MLNAPSMQPDLIPILSGRGRCWPIKTFPSNMFISIHHDVLAEPLVPIVSSTSTGWWDGEIVGT